MASDMPNRYLDREGIFEEDTKRVVKANDLASLESQNQTLQEEIALIKQTNEQINKELLDLRKKYDNLFEGKDFMKLLSSLAKKQQVMIETFNGCKGKRSDARLPSSTSISKHGLKSFGG